MDPPPPRQTPNIKHAHSLPSPLEHVVPWREVCRHAHVVHDLQRRQQRPTVRVPGAAAHTWLVLAARHPRVLAGLAFLAHGLERGPLPLLSNKEASSRYGRRKSRLRVGRRKHKKRATSLVSLRRKTTNNVQLVQFTGGKHASSFRTAQPSPLTQKDAARGIGLRAHSLPVGTVPSDKRAAGNSSCVVRSPSQRRMPGPTKSSGVFRKVSSVSGPSAGAKRYA